MSTLRSRARARAGSLLTVILVTAGCSLGNALEGEWLDASGRPVPNESVEGEGFVLATWVASGHCEWGSATFLLMSWPPGRVEADWDTGDIDTGAVRLYVRDPEGLFGADGLSIGRLDGAFDVDADLPASATTTGLHRSGWEIWTTPDDDGGLYLVGPERAERWQRARDYIGCA